MPKVKKPQTSTIQLTVETKAMLDKLGSFGDTYEDIVKRLIEFYQGKTKTT